MLSVTIVIPTRNEEDNIVELLMQAKSFGEVIVVDDSDDETSKLARAMGVYVIEGQRRGLGQAIIDGVKASDTDVVLVMDADLSHNPQDIPRLLKPILEQGADLVIASRYIKGGDVNGWEFKRRIQSLIGVKLMQIVTRVSDSNSGFFAFRKVIIHGVELKAHSWKIMLEVLFKGGWTFKAEVPIKFGDRKSGVSKNSVKERLAHAVHMLRLLIWKFRRYITFACVGGIGAIWYFGILFFVTEYIDIWYGLSAVAATFVAITNNYLINHFYTFKKEKRRNKSLIKGWFKYIANSAVGDGLDWLALIFLTEVFGIWYMLSAFIASGVASVVKYTIAKKYIWGKGKNSSDADYEWNAYFKGLPWQKRWKRIIAGIVKDYAEYPTGNAGRVLDFGCGSSPQGLLINHEDYTGFDTNNSKIRYMNSKELGRGNCYFLTGGYDVVEDSVQSDSMDVILFIEVIEHLSGEDEARQILRVMHSKLKAKGRLIIATPNFGGFMGKWMDRLYGVFQKDAYAKEHQLKFSFDSLRRLCESCRFHYLDSRIPSGADMICLFEKV